jgi:peptide/nickel transport system substrate-binding protein
VLQPHAGFLHGWTQLPILPEHLLGDTPSGELATHPFGTSQPVGNGPFRFVERRAGDRWVFEANPDFPRALGGRPYLDRLVYRIVPDETTLLSELRRGGVQLRVDLPPDQIGRVRDDPELEVLTYPSRSYTFIAWNSRRPLFRESGVRRALTMAIDRAALLRAVRNGLGTVAAGPLGPWHWASDPSTRPLPYAPDSARALLEAAGWTDEDGDGVRERSGRPFRFDLDTNDNRIRQDVAQIVQAQLAAVGVEARPRTLESASLGAAITSPDRRYDAVLLTFDQDWEVDDRSLWACDRIGQPFQFTSYCNPALDPILDSIPLALDRETRGSSYRGKASVFLQLPEQIK